MIQGNSTPQVNRKGLTMKRLLCIIALLVAGIATSAHAGNGHRGGGHYYRGGGHGHYVNRNVTRGFSNSYYRGGYNNFYRGGGSGLSISIGNPGFISPVYRGGGFGYGGGGFYPPGYGYGGGFGGGRSCGSGVGFAIGF